MGEVTIFSQGGALAPSKRGMSDLGRSVSTNTSLRRIQTNTNGTFRRIIGGEQVGKAIRGEFNAILVYWLPKVSRTYYAGAYDPQAAPTLPDCWSNLGDAPEPKAGKKQAANCASCPQNIEGSGMNGQGKACRFNRRVAVLLEGDESGDVYQFNIPAKSLFGKGSGNTHPFESYLRYLVANEHSPDYVVTKIAYDLDADTMEMNFTPVRPITDEEYELVVAAQSDPDIARYVQLTVGEAQGAKPKGSPEKETPAPATAKKASMFDEDDGDEEDAPAPKRRGRPAKATEVDEEEEIAEPVKRAPKKTEATKERETPKDMSAILDKWLTDDEEDDG